MRTALAIVVLASCSEARFQYAEYLESRRVASCQWYVRCGIALDMETCLREASPARVDLDVLGALEAGKLVFDADAARTCVAAMANLTCDRTSREYRNPRCRDVLRGTLGDAQPCAFAGECASRECWLQSELACDDAGCCRGTCVGEERPQSETIGGRCRFAPCVDAWCDASACVALLPEGADCDIDGDRWGRDACDYGLACFSGRCAPAVGSGESSIFNPCRMIGDIRGADGTCVRRRIAGERCFRSFEPECMLGLVCDDATATCVERDVLPPGERLPVGATCTYTSAPCEEGAFCDIADPASSLDGVCTLPKPVGAACHGDYQCASDSCNHLGVCIAEACF